MALSARQQEALSKVSHERRTYLAELDLQGVLDEVPRVRQEVTETATKVRALHTSLTNARNDLDRKEAEIAFLKQRLADEV